MDLFAYGQIEDLQKVADDNGIEIPRLRGYRLMKHEQPISKETIEEAKKFAEIRVVMNLCAARPVWNPNSDIWVGSDETDRLERRYLSSHVDDMGVHWTGVRWDRIHGRKRRILKREIKRQRQRIQNQYDMFNKYAGREDVLYIHSRMGGDNWKYWNGKVELMRQPWYLDRVDDHYDGTYCDFYAKINA